MYILYEFNCNRSIVNSLEVFSCLIIIREDFASLVVAGEEIVLQGITHIESRIYVYIHVHIWLALYRQHITFQLAALAQKISPYALGCGIWISTVKTTWQNAQS